MPTVQECVCCDEIEQVKKERGDEYPCIIGHPGFETVCLDKYVLKTAYLAYRQEYGHYQDNDNHARYRYTAYRQLVRWCFGYLGKEIRVPLPSCAVNRIREEYPSIDYQGFVPRDDLPPLG